MDDPRDVTVVDVISAQDMKEAVERALPADIAIFVAAVADWRVASPAESKIKKQQSEGPASLELVENPDILATISRHQCRPKLVVGFAAETDDLIAHATAKLARKGCDAIVANDVSTDADGGSVMGGDHNQVTLISAQGADPWPALSKSQTADRLAAWIAGQLSS